MTDDGDDGTRLTEENEDDREPDWGTNTSSPGDDGDYNMNKHNDKKKHHGDNAKKKH